MPTLKYRTRARLLAEQNITFVKGLIQEKLTDSKPASDPRQHVAESLKTKRFYDLVDTCIGVLAVIVIDLEQKKSSATDSWTYRALRYESCAMTYESPEKDIDNRNKELRAEHGFPEIHRMWHLGLEGNEQNGSGIGV